MDLGSVAPSTGAEWIGQPPHEELQRGARPQLPADDPFYDPPAGFEHAAPGTVLRSRDVELAFLGLIPQQLTATQLLYRTTDMHGNPEAAATTVIVPAERAPRGRHPVVSYQCAIDAVAVAVLPVLRAAPTRQGRRRGRAVRVPADRRRRSPRAGRSRCPTTRARAGMWGAPYEPGYHVLDGLRAALNHERLGLSPEAPIGLWGYSGGGLATRVGRRDERHLRTRTQRRRRGARLARSATSATPSAGSTAASIPACPRWSSPRSPTSIPTSTGSSRSTPPTRARRCCSGSRT